MTSGLRAEKERKSGGEISTNKQNHGLHTAQRLESTFQYFPAISVNSVK